MRSSFGSRRGFALAELLVVTAVLGLLMAGIFVLQQQGLQAYLLGADRVETQQNARVALDLMTRELRSAASITTIPSATDLTFVDQNGVTIRYYLSGSSPNFTLNRTVAGTNTALIGGVQSLAVTYCSAFDPNASPPCTATTTAALVTVIKIALRTKTEQGASAGSAGDQHATMESTIRLRATVY